MQLELIRNIYTEIKEIYGLFNKQGRKILIDLEITLPQLFVLRYLLEMEQENNQVTMTDLILKVDCSPSSMSTMIQRLEQEGLVSSVRGAQDRRLVFVRITEKGKEVLYPAELNIGQFMEEKYKNIENSELQHLYTSLIKFKKCLE